MKPYLYLIELHAMKAYGDVEVQTDSTGLDTRLRFSCELREGWVGPRAGVGAV